MAQGSSEQFTEVTQERQKWSFPLNLDFFASFGAVSPNKVTSFENNVCSHIAVDGFLQTFLVFNLQQHLLLITGIAISFSWSDFEWLVRYWHLRKPVNETSAVISLQKNSKKSDPNFEWPLGPEKKKKKVREGWFEK